MTSILRKKIHTETLTGRTIVGATDRGVEYRVFSNVLVKNVTVADSPGALQAMKFHNSDRAPAIEVEGNLYNLVLRDCDVSKVGGDGIYVTKVTGALVENCHLSTSSGTAADACQFAHEGDDSNISRDVLIRGNTLTYDPDGTSCKGALVCEKTINYRVEYNVLSGRNFALSSIGDGAVVRSNVMRGARLNNYSWGYGVGEQHHLSNHHVYDNLISDCARGIAVSGFGDDVVVVDGVRGYQRTGMDIHDNVIADCDVGFFADRPWTGAFRRNIILRCKSPTSVTGKGLGLKGWFVEGNYSNDGSFLNTEAPTMTLYSNGKAAVSAGRWSAEPDEIRYQWRDAGRDIPGAAGPSIRAKAGMELSCVVLARRGENWMLSIAQVPWPAGGFVPRADLPWGKRYFTMK